jgi:hypothetical protein
MVEGVGEGGQHRARHREGRNQRHRQPDAGGDRRHAAPGGRQAGETASARLESSDGESVQVFTVSLRPLAVEANVYLASVTTGRRADRNLVTIVTAPGRDADAPLGSFSQPAPGLNR